MNSAAAHTITLLASAPVASWFIIVKNINTGVLTVARNGLTIDGKSSNLTLMQGDSVYIGTDASNYMTGLPRTFDIAVTAPGVGTNNQILARFVLTRAAIFPASAPNSTGTASATATGNTTYTFKKGGVSFATLLYGTGSATGAYTQASDATFNGTSDLFEIDGPATADATLKDVGIGFQGYKF